MKVALRTLATVMLLLAQGGARGDGINRDGDDVDAELADVPLRPLEVRVADEHGTLVAAALTVRAAGYLATSDTEGMSTVKVPSGPGCVSVCASAEHRLEACAAVRGEARIGLVLREPTNVHGFVRLPGGAPAAGARVRCGGAGPVVFDGEDDYLEIRL